MLYTYDRNSQQSQNLVQQVVHDNYDPPDCKSVLDGGNDDNLEKLQTISEYIFGADPSDEKTYF